MYTKAENDKTYYVPKIGYINFDKLLEEWNNSKLEQLDNYKNKKLF